MKALGATCWSSNWCSVISIPKLQWERTTSNHDQAFNDNSLRLPYFWAKLSRTATLQHTWQSTYFLFLRSLVLFNYLLIDSLSMHFSLGLQGKRIPGNVDVSYVEVAPVPFVSSLQW